MTADANMIKMKMAIMTAGANTTRMRMAIHDRLAMHFHADTCMIC